MYIQLQCAHSVDGSASATAVAATVCATLRQAQAGSIAVAGRCTPATSLSPLPFVAVVDGVATVSRRCRHQDGGRTPREAYAVVKPTLYTIQYG
eukprot:COSAG02_NODE_1187_length_14003_cov_48.566240_2_plen_94_part_00